MKNTTSSKYESVVTQLATYERLDSQIFEQLKQFPDPTPGDDVHYLPFATIYGRATSEEHRPSKKKKSSKQRTLPFHGKLQNADLKLECGD